MAMIACILTRVALKGLPTPQGKLVFILENLTPSARHDETRNSA